MRKPKTFRPWNPEQTLLFLYAYCVGIPSSRVLTGNQQPDHSRTTAGSVISASCISMHWRVW